MYSFLMLRTGLTGSRLMRSLSESTCYGRKNGNVSTANFMIWMEKSVMR